MTLYPIKSSFYDGDDYIYSNYEAREGKATFNGDFGSIYIDHLDGYYSIERVRFDLKHQTWVYYKFSKTQSVIIQAIDYISFKIGDRKYDIQPNDFIHVSGYSSPEFLLFPEGKYAFYLISGTALETELNMCRLDHYEKIRMQINFFHRNNKMKNRTAKS